MLSDTTRPIGVYDSGVGGITVLRALQRALPHENFVYFADTANLPYGDKSPEEILSFSTNIIEWMTQEQNVKCVVAACNTSSAIALAPLSGVYKTPLIGTLYPLVRALEHYSRSDSFGILATQGTVKSRMHERLLRESGIRGKIISICCPDFVPFIEMGHLEDPRLVEAAKQYLKPLIEENVSTIIHGCTHYPWIAPLIGSLLPPAITLLDPAAAIVEAVIESLVIGRQLATTNAPGTLKIYCSQDAANFEKKLYNLCQQTYSVHEHYLSNSTTRELVLNHDNNLKTV